jgi:hypothetical protein
MPEGLCCDAIDFLENPGNHPIVFLWGSLQKIRNSPSQSVRAFFLLRNAGLKMGFQAWKAPLMWTFFNKDLPKSASLP